MNPSEPGSLPLAPETPQQVSTSHFKAHALVVTDHGRPSIEARPYRQAAPTVADHDGETLACSYWIPPC